MKSRLTLCLLLSVLGVCSLAQAQQAGAPQGNTPEKPAASPQSGGGEPAKQPAPSAKPSAPAKPAAANHAPAHPAAKPRPVVQRRVFVTRRTQRAAEISARRAQYLKQQAVAAHAEQAAKARKEREAQAAAQAEKARKEHEAQAAALAAKTQSSQAQSHPATPTPTPTPAAAASLTPSSASSTPASSALSKPASGSSPVPPVAASTSGKGATGTTSKNPPSAPASSGSTTASSSAQHPPTQASAPPANGSSAAAGTTGVSRPADPVLSQTKPDIAGASGTSSLDHTIDSPLSAVGDSWKMIAYLLPTLIFIVVCLNLLRRYQQRKGQLPGFVQAAARRSGRASAVPPKTGGLWSAMLGSFHLNNAREAGGSSIRLLESIPVGGANLHLVQVRGRLLLLGATGGGVSVLTEFREQEGMESDDFRAMLQAAAAGMDDLEPEESGLPASAVVGSLDDVMRETGESMQRRILRLRTVQEAEDAVD